MNEMYNLERCSLPNLYLSFFKSPNFLYAEFTIPSMYSDQLRFCDNKSPKWRWVETNSSLSPSKNNMYTRRRIYPQNCHGIQTISRK